MKNYRIFLLSLFLLAILTVGFASATEDNLTVSDNQTLQSVDEDIISIDSDSQEDGELSTDEDNGTYLDPTEAYECLNEFRTSEGVWYWDSDNENVYYFNTNDDNRLKPLVVDERLEETAKIRAKEISILFEHQRPDGTDCFTAYPTLDGNGLAGENIAWSYLTGKDVTEAWKESVCWADGQGHRRNMLSSGYNCVGIGGYLDSNGVPHWVQAFGNKYIPETPIVKNETQRNESKATFTDLNNLIASNNLITLDKDYEFYNESAFDKGIVINKSVTIDGCGHSIDGNRLARIFNITSPDVILKNIMFLNTYIDYENGGAVYTNVDVTLINCTFKNNFAYHGSAVYATNGVLSLINCYFNDNYAVEGAVYADGGVISIEDCSFDNNSAMVYGAAICLHGAEAILTDSIFTNNFAYLKGGAINLVKANITTKNCTFSNNALNSDAYAFGAVMYGDESSVTCRECSFKDNKINSDFRAANGGVLFLIDGQTSFIDCNFTDNFAMYYGGALCLINDEAVVERCRFNKNSLNDGYYTSNGGAIYSEQGNITISDCSFLDNFAHNGAAIAINQVDFTLNDCDFLNNLARSNGGAIYSTGSNATIQKSTFVNNSAGFNGGALSFTGGNVSCSDSIFKYNNGTYGGAIRFENALISIINDTFTDNEVNYDYATFAGAVFLGGCQGNIELCNFTNNSAYSPMYITKGGAIHCENTKASLTACNFWNNSAYVGGALSTQNSTLTITDSKFDKNAATYGGAIYSKEGNIDIYNSDFNNNSANYGGAAYSDGAIVNAIDSGFTGNTATWHGGALYYCNAVNSTFIENKANSAGAMSGNNNSADKCKFIKNVAYNDNPVSGVSTKDCSFTGNIQITQATLEVPYLESEYYPGDRLYIQVYASYSYQIITNATVTMKLYKGNELQNTFKFSSGDMGWTVNVSEGTYFAELSIEDIEFEADPINITFNVAHKEIANVDVSVNSPVYSNPATVNFLSSVDGDVEVYIDDFYVDYQSVAANANKQMSYYGMNSGSHVLRIVMTPTNSKIDPVTITKDFTVQKKETTINLDVENTVSGDNVVVYVKASENGNVLIKMGDVSQDAYVNANERTQIFMGAMNSGTYVVSAKFSAGDNYVDSETSKILKIFDKITQDDIKIAKGESENLVINLPPDATGTVTLSINGENYNVDIIDGVAEVNLSDLAKGEYSYTITYSGDDKYDGFDITGDINTASSGENPTIKLDIVIPPIDEDGQIQLPQDATGTVTLTINGNDYIFDVIDGTANVELPKLANGAYLYTITYSGDGKYSSFAQTSYLEVNRPVVISVSNLKATYSAGAYCQITVKNDLGIAADGVVVITQNGKKFKTLTTKNGVCKFKITQKPGSYKLIITAQSKSVSKTLTVKHLLSLKKVTPKKSAKKLVLTATLAKVNKKYLKNKKITFKFNGKKYTAKTNKKGVAKVTVKKAVLKKLKVGKKITYQATYLKDTVKYSVKVKK